MSKKYGARNTIEATVTAVKRGDVMSLLHFDVVSTGGMASVITTESLEELGLVMGDKVQLIIKAIHVLPVKGA
jgi:molybdopterin-binding protein